MSELTNLMIMIANAASDRDKFKVERDELLAAANVASEYIKQTEHGAYGQAVLNKLSAAIAKVRPITS